MENLGYLEIFRQRWLAIVVALVLGVGVAAIAAFTIPPTYTAKATLFLSVQDDASTLTERSQFSLARIASYPGLVRSDDVLQPTIDELGLDLTAQELAGKVSASIPDSTVTIEVSAQDGSRGRAAAIANTVADKLSALVAEVENNSTFAVSLDLLIPAFPPTSPSAPQKVVILGLGLIVGLALGAVAALFLARFDRRVRTVTDVRRASGLPVLGVIPRRNHALLRGADPMVDTAMTDAILNIRQANADGVPRMMLLVPAGRGSASARIRFGLARAWASTGRTVLLVETERGNSDELGNLTNAPGLAELLEGTATLAGTARTVDQSGVRVLPAGTAATTDVQAEEEIRSVIAHLVFTADIVIAQTTPSTRPASLPLLAPFADVTIVVARHGRSTGIDVARAVTQLRIAGIRPIGTILVDVPRGKRTDPSATWLPEDLAEKPSEPIIRLDFRKPPAPRKVSPALAAASKFAEEQVVPG